MELRKKSMIANLIQNNIRSLISYDKGSNWSLIKAPLNSFMPCLGNEECSLNLFIKKFTTTPLKSKKNSPGIIIANGNTGHALLTAEDETQVYLSLDGGQSWKEVAKKPHILSISDNGGIIAIAKIRSSAIKYSLNGGRTWTKEVMTSRNGTIINIFTEPNIDTQYFLVQAEFFGTSSNESTRNSIYSVNLNSFYNKKCDLDIDYETWQPYGADKCFMGRKVTYIRKYPDSLCYNDLKTLEKIEDCECTEDDYECDYGFIRQNGSCIASNNSKTNYCEGSSGYRKIIGDTCKGGLKYHSGSVICSNSIVEGSSLWIMSFIGLCGVGVTIFYYVYISSLKKNVNELGKFKYQRADIKGEEETSIAMSDI